ncbi:MAG: NUDIX domain-containing protein [Deltaproteobacteria bacterium]|nr:NUDIX domain-containing protein [Deltaproteobacteria bacterium]
MTSSVTPRKRANQHQVHAAATTVCLRDGKRGLEVLLVRRTAKLVFYGGAWVFPGGRVDPGDAERAGIDTDDLYCEAAARQAAAREAHEEAKVVVDPEALVPISHWTTPPGRPRRFATWFFVAHTPVDDVEVDAGEIEQHRWFTLAEALSAHGAGHIELPPPTYVTLDQLRAHELAAQVIQVARDSGSPVVRYVPKPIIRKDGVISLYEGDAGYNTGDPSAKGRRHRLSMLQDGWRYER